MRTAATLLALLLSLTATSHGEFESRLWTGKNGKTIKGRLMYPNEGDSTVQILTVSGKSYLIQYDNLSDADQAYVKEMILRQKKEKEAAKNQEESTGVKAAEPNPHEFPSREWAPRGLPPVVGRYLQTSIDGRWIQIRGTDNREQKLEIQRLSEADQTWLKNILPRRIAASDAQRRTGEGPFAGFKPLPEFDRLRIPVINQGDFGSKASDCVPSSFCNFLLWWDREGYLRIPKRGDFEDKADWVHTRVARYCGTRNNSGTYTDDATEGFRKYFTKDIEDLATLQVRIDHDIRPENLARYTVGDQATMLAVTIRQRPSHDSGHWVALVDAKPDGSIVFNTWGTQFRGRIKVLEESEEVIRREGQTIPKTTYTIEITNRDDLPEWFISSERELILNPENWDYIYVVRPYVYAEEGKPVPAPSDPMMEG